MHVTANSNTNVNVGLRVARVWGGDRCCCCWPLLSVAPTARQHSALQLCTARPAGSSAARSSRCKIAALSPCVSGS